jgi:hypothetical protein
MKRAASLALLALALASAPVAAQGPGPMRGGPGGPPQGAQFLLAHTGALELTDAQVVRLAAIARRAHQRHEALRAGMPAPGAPRAQPSPEDAARMRQAMEQGREQARVDLRDALAVLTPDQQARAWEMMARRGGGPGGRGGPDGPGGMRGRGGPDGPGGRRGADGPGGRGEGRPGAPPAQAPDGAERAGQQ